MGLVSDLDYRFGFGVPSTGSSVNRAKDELRLSVRGLSIHRHVKLTAFLIRPCLRQALLGSMVPICKPTSNGFSKNNLEQSQTNLKLLGPVVMTEDGKLGRLSNWHEMTEHER